MSQEQKRTFQPIKRVLIPTDFSKNAARAIERALLLPLDRGARLHLVHVLPRSVPAKFRVTVEAGAQRALEEAISATRASAQKRGIEGLNITSGLRVGEPFVEIIRASRTLEAELIVLGRHGQRPLRDMFIGTTAERVVRKGEVPVLVVNLKPEHAYTRPLLTLALDGSSRETARMMLRLMGPRARGATVVHGFDVPFESFVTPGHPLGEMTAYRKACREAASAGVKKFLASVAGLGFRWRVALRPGDARTVILKESVRQRAELIVLGTHGRSGMAHALLGSVAEWVVTSARCDVLVVRPARVSIELP
jgi:nucleotide-binding universal stress UspA family protein